MNREDQIISALDLKQDFMEEHYFGDVTYFYDVRDEDLQQPERILNMLHEAMARIKEDLDCKINAIKQIISENPL